VLSSSNFGNNRPKVNYNDLEKLKKERESFREQKKLIQNNFNIEF
jgi:hypothetical protein